jgi:sugar phosphate isomerase/epimerase
LETARQLVAAAGSNHVMLMADSFHMNIEEVDIPAALESVAPWLRYIHLADNNRMAPGMGHFDLEAFLASLSRIGYEGAGHNGMRRPGA